MLYKLGISALCIFMFNGCVTSQAPEHIESSLKTLYDFQILDQEYRTLDMQELAHKLQVYDVVFVGEFHGNQASHLFEAQLFAALKQQKHKNIILSLEMFERDQQNILNEYRENKIGEEYLVNKAPAWKGYKGRYRPVVEYAKENNVAIVAANAPGEIVRCVGKYGPSYVEKLTSQEKTYIAREPFYDFEAYKESFFALMGEQKHMPKNKLLHSYYAQIIRDNTMAESIYNAYKKRKNTQVLHLNGNFHSKDHLGTVSALKYIDKTLSLAVIEPIYIQESSHNTVLKKDTFYYIVKAQPEQFVNENYRQESLKQKFEKSREKAKTCRGVKP